MFLNVAGFLAGTLAGLVLVGITNYIYNLFLNKGLFFTK